MPKPKFCLKCHAVHSGECWEYWKAKFKLEAVYCAGYAAAFDMHVREDTHKGILIKKLQRTLSKRDLEVKRSWWRCW